ncbi:ABC transporter ATP-binding protein, partial [Streptomyces oceani]
MELRAVGRRYGGPGSPWVLREVDAALPEATVLRVTGDNGSGKSTLLRLLAGIDAPSRGRVTEVPRPVGYVPERFPVALPFGPLGYLTHQARIRGMRRRAAARTAREWLERFGAAGHTHTPMAELSKGTSQKVAVAQALLVRPRLLVLDEAWTGLDPAAREELDRVVAETVAAGGTVVYVDHQAERLADSVGQSWRVADGRLHVESTGTDGPDGGPAGPRVQVTVSGPPGA